MVYVPDATLVSSIGEERRPGLGQLAAIWMQANDRQIGLRDRGADEPVPPHFALDLFALAGGDALFLIIEIHWTDFFRITPVLWC